MAVSQKVLRFYVEKREAYNILAKRFFADVKITLGLDGLKNLRIIDRYLIQGLSQEEFDRVVKEALTEENTDLVYDSLPKDLPPHHFLLESLPGQFDQASDSASQCIALATEGEAPLVQIARLYAFEGEITEAEFEKIKKFIINPVETRLAKDIIPESIEIVSDFVADVIREEGFIKLDAKGLEAFRSQYGFAMSFEDLEFVRKYFAEQEQRDPSITELKMIDTYWSDHCRHTTFFTRLEDIQIEKGGLSWVIEDAFKNYLESRKQVYADRQKDISLMDMATIATKRLKQKGLLNDLDESDEINACSIVREIEVDGQKESWLIQFKNETHNHPTEIEPFGGASTCLGGAIRDPLSGRAYVYQAMRITGAANPNTPYEATLEGKLPQKTITVKASEGYSAYGNQIGAATGQVTEIYDEGYLAKRMELGAVIGACPKSNVRREKPTPGDIIILLGGKTGRDGIGGATSSSKAHDTDSSETCGAEVQKGNPLVERYIQRLFRKPEVSTLIKKCNDFGAGGVSVAIGELADGLKIDLDKVPVKYPGLDGTELAISESQERMAVLVEKDDAEAFISFAEAENLEATVVAQVTEDPRLVMYWRGDKIVDLSRAFLDTNGVTQRVQVYVGAPKAEDAYIYKIPEELEGLSKADALRANLARLNVASQKGLIRRFDSGTCATQMPLGGKSQLTPEEAMLGKIPLEKGNTDDVTAMSFGFIPGISRWSPFHGAAYAVTESLARLAAAGVDTQEARLSMQEYFERLDEIPERWGKPTAALLGALEAQMNFEVPAIGGKDSMSGTFNEIDVPPTLVCFALSMAKASEVGSAAFKKANSKVVLVKLPVDKDSLLPVWKKAKELFKWVSDSVRKGDILSAGLVREGGAAATVSKMAFGNMLGFNFEDSLSHRDLFAPLSASFVLELAEGFYPIDFEFVALGSTKEDAIFTIDKEIIKSDDLLAAWSKRLEDVFPTFAEEADMTVKIPSFNQRPVKGPAVKTASPQVLIPILPGTASETETAKAFENAGGNARIFIFRNRNEKDIKNSFDEFSKLLAESQILVLPGGHSGGDEPAGAGKFYTALLKNERVAQGVNELLKARDGLVLGFADGFRALLQTGLLPSGKPGEITIDSPSLSLNAVGSHVSQMVYTRVTSVKSPWFSLVNVGDIFALPFSHTHGRFYAPAHVAEKLASEGQVASQYVDLSGHEAAAMPYNPSASVSAIEALTDREGRVLGRMALNQRIEQGLYTNVPFEKDQKIFEAGVRYFK